MKENNLFDTKSFRRALGNFATGVTVITASDHQGKWVGVTANSFSSVSLDPPLVLWSLNRSAWSLPTFELADNFVVNVLTDNQINISNRFASQGLGNKFEGLATCEGLGGTPVLSGCAASFQCRKKFTYEGGDHLIFVGEVLEFDTSDSSGLIYHKGQYAVPELHPELNLDEEDVPETSFSEGYLDYLVSQIADGFERQYQTVLDRYAMTRFEWRVLCCISEFQGVSDSELALLTLIPEDALRTITDAEKLNGWIRGDTTSDKEVFFVEAAGLDILVPLMAAAKAHESQALDVFSNAEVRQFKSMLKSLMKRVSARGTQLKYQSKVP